VRAQGREGRLYVASKNAEPDVGKRKEDFGNLYFKK